MLGFIYLLCRSQSDHAYGEQVCESSSGGQFLYCVIISHAADQLVLFSQSLFTLIEPYWLTGRKTPNYYQSLFLFLGVFPPFSYLFFLLFGNELLALQTKLFILELLHYRHDWMAARWYLCWQFLSKIEPPFYFRDERSALYRAEK